MDMLVGLLMDMRMFMEAQIWWRNPGDRALEFDDATEMVGANTFFKKRDSRLVAYQSGNSNSQLDYVLVRISI